MSITSITVSPETLKLANRVKSWRQYKDIKKYTIDEALNIILNEEIQRINENFKKK